MSNVMMNGKMVRDDGLREESRSGSLGDTLYRVIIKKFKDQVCSQHHLQYEYYYGNAILCKSCLENEVARRHPINSQQAFSKIERFYHLSFILNHPMLLLAKETDILQHSAETINLIFTSYRQLYAKKQHFQIQKSLLHSFISRIKDKINLYCDEIMAEYDKLAQSLAKQHEYREEMKNINQVYEDTFLQLMAEREYHGCRTQLANIFKEYTQHNENPFSTVFNNLDSFMTQLSMSPIINTQHLVSLYTTITDQHLWKISEIVTTHKDQILLHKQRDNGMILTDELILQKQYHLSHDNQGLVLNKDGNMISKLNTCYDSLYHYSKYRLIGINYDKIDIINYFDQLKVERQLSITGCTDLLAFQSILIVISQEKLLRINAESGQYEVLDINCRDLKYVGGSGDVFECFNSMGKRVRWHLFERKSMIVNIQ